MHECEECGQACDCDGDDLWRDKEPRNHECINPECEMAPEMAPHDFEPNWRYGVTRSEICKCGEPEEKHTDAHTDKPTRES